ncbi:hypothetical protein EV697_105115 [Bisgaardia hudsonensis]|uniref:Uncharacterized protein n=1 Tax=Bisgaardia hudsonensis TaxID=109472 RepID=A0A4R2MV38_9PAST|nr:hypothetical protein [Bisgaardia hudsonensis]TCP12003.1 hypothetical protein EV697_105115 [Bisgaardia hudsonensis]
MKYTHFTPTILAIFCASLFSSSIAIATPLSKNIAPYIACNAIGDTRVSGQFGIKGTF